METMKNNCIFAVENCAIFVKCAPYQTHLEIYYWNCLLLLVCTSCNFSFWIFLQFQLRNVTTVIGEQAELRKKKMLSVVKQLVFLMIAYAVIMALTFTPICALQQHAKQLEYYINKYFACLMFFPPEKCPKSKWFWIFFQEGVFGWGSFVNQNKFTELQNFLFYLICDRDLCFCQLSFLP